jgi:hypothetical protein
MCATEDSGETAVASVSTSSTTEAAPERRVAAPPSSRDARTPKHIHFDEGNLQENEAERLKVERMRIEEPKTPYHEPFAEPHAGLGSLSASEGSETEELGLGCYVSGLPVATTGRWSQQMAPINGGPGYSSRSSTPESSSSNASGRRLSHEEFEEKRRALYNNEYRQVRLYRQGLFEDESNDVAVPEHLASAPDKSQNTQNSRVLAQSARRAGHLGETKAAKTRKR